MTIKKILTQKICSEQDYEKHVAPHIDYTSQTALRNDLLLRTVAVAPFWAKRERLRIAHGVYTISEKLTEVNKLFPVYAHVSQKDKTLVAYTEDRQSGIEDRQRPMAPGRFFSKMYPLYSDERIREITEHHLAEICMEVEFLYGEDIVNAYMSPTTIGSCMAGKPEDTWDIHPSVIYMQPNIAMAVARNSLGHIIARSMVFMPSETDKRWIRGYGHPSLIKCLEREGFKKGSFAGAKLNAVALLPGVKMTPEEHAGYVRRGFIPIVAPYIDANGGLAETIGSTLALVDNELRVLTQSQYSTLRAIKASYTAMGNTTGYCLLEPFDSTDQVVADCLTGASVNPLFLLPGQKVKTVFVNGTLGKTLVQQEDLLCSNDRSDWLPECKALDFVNVCSGYLANRSECVETSEGQWCIDSPKHLSDAGWFRLEPTLYPNTKLVRHSKMARTTVSDLVILKEDVVTVVTADDEVSHYHKSEVPTGLIRLYGKSLFDGPIFAHPKASWIRVGPNRLKAHTQTHSIVQMFDDSWVFSRGKASVTWGTHVVWYDPKKSTLDEMQAAKSVELAVLERAKVFVNDLNRPENLLQALHRLAGTAHADISCGEAGDAADTWLRSKDLERVSCSRLVSRLGYGEWTDVPMGLYYVMWNKAISYLEAYLWKRISPQCLALKVLKRLGYAVFDEALAVEAPHYLVDLPTERVNLIPLTEENSSEVVENVF